MRKVVRLGHLEATAVGKTFGRFEALRDVSFSVEQGECLVLFGASGAGKTTLLRLIAGLETPTSGGLELDGQNLNGMAANDRGVALLSQSVSLYPQLNVRKNLEAALKGKQVGGRTLSRSERETKILAMLSGFGVEGLATKLPSQLSGGEAQRVAFARALVAEPKLLLLDEPLSQLDGPNRESAISLLKEVAERFRPTTIMVSHDPVDAMRLGNQVAILDAGAMLDSGTPETVYRNPSCRASADLFGVWGMNWFDQGQLPLPETLQRKERWVGFRPEAALLKANTDDGESKGADGREGTALTLTGQLQSCIFVGGGHLFELSIDGTRVRALSSSSNGIAASDQTSKLTKGDLMTISVPFDQLRWTDS